VIFDRKHASDAFAYPCDGALILQAHQIYLLDSQHLRNEFIPTDRTCQTTIERLSRLRRGLHIPDICDRNIFRATEVLASMKGAWYLRGFFLEGTMEKIFIAIIITLLTLPLSSFSGQKVVADTTGQEVTLPNRVEHVICSGAGCLRLLTYLQAQHLIIAVDDMEKRRPKFDARPYALAHPEFKKYPLFGEFRGYDNPELIMALNPAPQVIFKTFSTMGHDPEKLRKKTSIPVVVLEYGDLASQRYSLYQALRIMGKVVDKGKRTEELVSFFESTIEELKDRTQDFLESERKSCFVGGIAFKGPHGFQSTELDYPPFLE